MFLQILSKICKQLLAVWRRVLNFQMVKRSPLAVKDSVALSLVTLMVHAHYMDVDLHG